MPIPHGDMPFRTDQILSDLQGLSILLKQCSILGAGLPLLRVATMGQVNGWYPEWQSSQFPEKRMIDLPLFFREYRDELQKQDFTLQRLIEITEDLVDQYGVIMRREFEDAVDAYNSSISITWPYDRDEFKKEQMKMFFEAMKQQGNDFFKFLEKNKRDFHVKVAGILCKLSTYTLKMLSQGNSLKSVESALMHIITHRNGTILLHQPSHPEEAEQDA